MPQGSAPANLDRLWTIANPKVQPDEKGKGLATVVGYAITTGTSTTTMQRDYNAGHRDGLFFMPARVLIVGVDAKPKSTALDVIRLHRARNNDKKAEKLLSEMGTRVETSIPRWNITQVTLDENSPPNWRLTGATFLHVHKTDGSQLHFLVDTNNTKMDRLTTVAETYTDNGDRPTCEIAACTQPPHKSNPLCSWHLYEASKERR